MNKTIVLETATLPQYICQSCQCDLRPDSYGDYCPECQRAAYDVAEPSDEDLACWDAAYDRKLADDERAADEVAEADEETRHADETNPHFAYVAGSHHPLYEGQGR